MTEETERARKVALNDPEQRRIRGKLAAYAAEVFHETGQRLHVAGHIFGGSQ